MDNKKLNNDDGVKKLLLCQPDTGYRHSLDPVLLSRFAIVKSNERVIDLGCGVGVILLRLACDVDAEMIGIEIQKELSELAMSNVAANGCQDRIRIVNADIRALPREIEQDVFDVVVTNPPYRKMGTGRIAPEDGRAIARHEMHGNLTDFLKAASLLLKTGGRFYIVYLAERLTELLTKMHDSRIEPKRLQSVHSRAGEGARLVLIEGRKNGRPGLQVESPLIVYQGPGRSYSKEFKKMFPEIADACHGY